MGLFAFEPRLALAFGLGEAEVYGQERAGALGVIHPKQADALGQGGRGLAVNAVFRRFGGRLRRRPRSRL